MQIPPISALLSLFSSAPAVPITLRAQILNHLANPNIALTLLVAGALLIYLECNRPGTVVPGALGTVMVLLAVYALTRQPFHPAAVDPWVAAALVLALGVIPFLLLRVALAARRNKARTGPAALVGSLGTTLEPIQTRNTFPVGRILIQGEIWPATAAAPVPEKAPVRITGVHENTLEVVPEPLSTN